jgi:hypothetical protein
MSSPVRQSKASITIDPWPSERPLFLLALLVSLALWLLAAITIVGIVYGAFFGIFFFVMHLGFVAYVRGNAVRLGPDQFPELHTAIVRLAGPIGLGGWAAATKLPAFMEEAKRKTETQTNAATSPAPANPLDSVQVAQDLERIGRFVMAEQAAGRGIPTNSRDLWFVWKATYPGEPMPKDAFDGSAYGYYRTGDGFVLWSSGPDGESDTEDDIEWRSPAQVSAR